MEAGDLLLDLRSGRPRAIARAISLVENGGPSSAAIIKGVFGSRRKALVLGITGASGTGKSTLVDQIIVRLRSDRKKVAVLAIDPSSPYTGGAILGDRVRMMRHSTDPGVFIRSMAARGRLGGLAKAVGAAIAVCEAAGMDFVVVETLGVGQDEVEIARLADVVAVVLTPGGGDDIQAVKAGLTEIADLLVINKADRPGAETLSRRLRTSLEPSRTGRLPPRILRTVATRGRGVDNLLAEALRLLEARPRAEAGARRKRLASWMLREILQEKMAELMEERLPAAAFARAIERISRRVTDPYGEAEKLVAALIGRPGREARSK